jgi:hypothetical protein
MGVAALNFPAALFLFFALPLVVLVLARLLAGRSRWTVLAGLAAAGTALSLGAWALSRPAVGTVTGKTEYFELAMRGVEPRATRHLLLTVAGSDLGSMRFNVERRVYDAFRVGQPASLRYVRLGPLRFGRLDAEPWWNLLPGRFEERLPPPQPSALLSARATVDSARTVRDAYVLTWASLFSQSVDVAHITLEQPYDEVQFRFSTPDGADIVALDRVDSGSAGVLAAGATVRVSYPSTDPHRAHLELGTRNHISRNARRYWTAQVLLAAGLALFVACAILVRRLVRRRNEATAGSGSRG